MTARTEVRNFERPKTLQDVQRKRVKKNILLTVHLKILSPGDPEDEIAVVIPIVL